MGSNSNYNRLRRAILGKKVIVNSGHCPAGGVVPEFLRGRPVSKVKSAPQYSGIEEHNERLKALKKAGGITRTAYMNLSENKRRAFAKHRVGFFAGEYMPNPYSFKSA